jgi:hypothetical protein
MSLSQRCAEAEFHVQPRRGLLKRKKQDALAARKPPVLLRKAAQAILFSKAQTLDRHRPIVPPKRSIHALEQQLRACRERTGSAPEQGSHTITVHGRHNDQRLRVEWSNSRCLNVLRGCRENLWIRCSSE